MGLAYPVRPRLASAGGGVYRGAARAKATAHALRDLLNQLRWDPASEASGVVLEVHVRRDGAEALEEVPYAAVVEVLAAGVILAGETFIPYHRVGAVCRGSETLWARRPTGGEGEG